MTGPETSPESGPEAGPETSGAPVLCELVDGVLGVTINRPHRRNALDDAAWDGLREALSRARRDPEVKVVVLTGAGGAFCAGADLAKADGEPAHPLTAVRGFHEVPLLLHDLPKPTIAKVRGTAVGAGWNLALGCDLVVADHTARFSQIFTKRGLSPDLGGTWLLPRLVGMLTAKRLTLLAEMIDAAEAERLGLVTALVADDELDGVVAGLAARLAAGPPIALGQTKLLLHENADRTLREALESEARAQAVNLATTDAAAAFAAFREKREPVYTGQWGVR